MHLDRTLPVPRPQQRLDQLGAGRKVIDVELLEKVHDPGEAVDDYRPVETDGAARAAGMLAQLL